MQFECKAFADSNTGQTKEVESQQSVLHSCGISAQGSHNEYLQLSKLKVSNYKSCSASLCRIYAHDIREVVFGLCRRSPGQYSLLPGNSKTLTESEQVRIYLNEKILPLV